jgi:hypothetical protein
MWARSFVVAVGVVLSLWAGAVCAEEEEQPSLELLEFLADWETSEGQWIDPTELDQWTVPDKEEKHEKEKTP